MTTAGAGATGACICGTGAGAAACCNVVESATTSKSLSSLSESDCISRFSILLDMVPICIVLSNKYQERGKVSRVYYGVRVQVCFEEIRDGRW